MWAIDLEFLQESANIFLEEFIKKYYKIYTKAGREFLVINEIKNYPHLIGIHRPQLGRLRGAEFLFSSIQQNDVSLWTDSMKREFARIFPNNRPYGINDIKITFFPLMPDIFVKDNYVISVNYDRCARCDNRPFDTEILISDFNDGMNIGMKQRNDGSFGFNSWRVEENEQRIMNMYLNQEIDLIKKIESFKDGRLIQTKILELSNPNLWRLSRLKRNYSTSFMDSDVQSKIHFLAQFKDDEYEQGFKEMNNNL